jgi:predicted branched-subunit amino acid permease
MRSLARTDPLVRSVLAVATAVFVVGASFGAIAAAAQVRLLETMAMSVFVFAGGAQFLAVGVVSAGGSAVAAVLAGLLLNARHLPFGLAIGDVIGRRPLHRAVGSHLIVDESVAFALSQADPGRQRRAYWLAGSALFVSWNIGTVLGFVAGASVGDPATFGIDAAFPAGLLALLWPSLRQRPELRVAVASGALALATTPFLPPGLPVLVALLGLAAALPVPRQLPAKR